MTDPLLQQTFKGVFRLAAPEIALVATACVDGDPRARRIVTCVRR